MLRGRRSQPLPWRAVVAASLLVAVAAVRPDIASAQGFFDFLFGGPQRPPPPSWNPEPPPPPRPSRISPAPLGQESVHDSGGSTGHAVVFCVRLCDGEHFPMEQMANATPADTCRAICPNSVTKVFYGAEIASAVARDGARYADLNTAFLYRKHLVPNCTCTGKDAFGLVPLDVKTDPTLRPGDIVSTKEGLMAYSGKNGRAAAFTPLDRSAAAGQLDPAAPKQPRAAPPAEQQPEIADEPGTIVRPGAPAR